MKNFVLGLAALCGLTSPSAAQTTADYFGSNSTYLGQINGQPVLAPATSALLTVCLVTGTTCTTATVYQDAGLTLAMPQPFYPDRLGNFGSWAAPGTYRYTACYLGSCTTVNLPTGC